MNSEINKFLKKYGNTKSLYIIVIIGVVLMLISTGNEPQNDTKAPVYEAYSDEARLEKILSKIDGVGDVSVMITYYGTTTYDVAYEKKESRSEKAEEFTKSEENSVITKGGEPLLLGTVYPKARGAVIIAEGAGRADVKKALTDAVSAVLDIASHKVCVLEGKDVAK